ncbi:MAG: hypothetical protein FD180_855 [Planctomycetota bacterium]|nr:MAG: hypothetical protein FD180_855 [Planctomycetota bacterium]
MTTDLKVAVRDSRQRTRIWDARSGRLIEELEPGGEDCDSLGVASPDGRWEAVNWPRCVAVHDTRTGKIATRTSLDWPFQVWSWSPDGRRLLLMTKGVWKGSDFLWVWSPFEGEEPRKLDTYYSDMSFSITGAAWSPDGRTIVSAAHWGLGFFDADSRALLARHSERTRVSSVAWSSRGILALKRSDAGVRLVRPRGRFPSEEEIESVGVLFSSFQQTR